MKQLAVVLMCGGVLVLLGGGCGGPPLSSNQQIAELSGGSAVPPPAPAPAAEDPYRPIAVRFGKFTGLLGGRGLEKQRLKIIIEPLDAEGDVVKRAGSLEVEALEEDAKQEPRLFHRWEFPQEELSQAWLSGLGAYAYILKLPWPDGRGPAANQLLLRATFTTLDGEALTAETWIDLRQPVLQP